MPGISRPFEAYLDEMRTITVLVPKSRASSCSPPFLLEDDQGGKIELSVKATEELEEKFKYVLESSRPVPFGRVHKVCCEESVWTDLQIGSVTRSAAFDKAFFYDGRLGAFYSKERTLFKVWAPTASTAAIKLESPDSLQTNTFQMMRREKGVFEVTVEGDLNGWSYLYKLYVNGTPLLTVDPYAKAVTRGKGRCNRS